MNKSELISALSEETNFSKKDVAKVLAAFTRIIERTLKSVCRKKPKLKYEKKVLSHDAFLKNKRFVWNHDFKNAFD